MRNRRQILKELFFGATLMTVSPLKLFANEKETNTKLNISPINGHNDREYWAKLLYRIVDPVVTNMAMGTLRKNMIVEKPPRRSHRAYSSTYLEAVGRTLAGVAPWLALPDDNTEEGRMRKDLKEKATKGLENCFNSSNPDYLHFEKGDQILVDAAFLSHAFLRAPKSLWEPLSKATKKSVIDNFKSLRNRKAHNNNWYIFLSLTEAFILWSGNEHDNERLMKGVHKITDWYVGDGWYSDGPKFSFDYYNSYVIHPMLIDTLDVLVKKNMVSREEYDKALKRMGRHAEQQERMISPEGTFPPIGRSLVYRTGAFQALAQVALLEKLPEEITPAQVRGALTAVMKNMYAPKDTFNIDGFLQLGFVGHQPDIADAYSSTGSLYMATLGFLPLGLPADNYFWTAKPEPWTAKKAWKGQSFKKDYHVSY